MHYITLHNSHLITDTLRYTPCQIYTGEINVLKAMNYIVISYETDDLVAIIDITAPTLEERTKLLYKLYGFSH
jgi:hypothetical protein